MAGDDDVEAVLRPAQRGIVDCGGQVWIGLRQVVIFVHQDDQAGQFIALGVQSLYFVYACLPEQGGPAVYWRQDGKEMYYFTSDRGLMAVGVSTAPTFKFGEPKLLFRLSEALTLASNQASVSRDGQRVLIAVPHAPTIQQITVFDRQGKVVATVGERAIYDRPVFSPDRTRLAVRKEDLESETQDVWVLDMATGNSTRITSNQTQEQERTRWPVWSPDGSQVAYVALRGGYWGLYRKASNGEGTEELLYQHPGANMILADWSLDGRFLSFSTTDLSGGTLYALPLAGDGERKPIVVFRSESQLGGPRLSPDSRFLAYGLDQSGRFEL